MSPIYYQIQNTAEDRIKVPFCSSFSPSFSFLFLLVMFCLYFGYMSMIQEYNILDTFKTLDAHILKYILYIV